MRVLEEIDDEISGDEFLFGSGEAVGRVRSDEGGDAPG